MATWCPVYLQLLLIGLLHILLLLVVLMQMLMLWFGLSSWWPGVVRGCAGTCLFLQLPCAHSCCTSSTEACAIVNITTS